MTTGTSREEVIRILRQHNEWRHDRDRAVEKVPTQLVGKAIDAAVELLSQPAAQPSSQPTDAKQPQVGTIGHVSDGAGTLIGSLSGPIASALSSSQPPAAPEQVAEQRQAVSEQNARFAIETAIEYGRAGTNKPPTDDHWLMPFWNIGRRLASTPPLDGLLATWRKRSADALPVDAMLINKHIRELEECLASSQPSQPAGGTVTDIRQEARNRVCTEGHLNRALDAVMASREPDATFNILGVLAYAAIEIALSLQSAERGKDAEDAELREIIDAAHWSIAFLYQHSEIGKAELLRKATQRLERM